MRMIPSSMGRLEVSNASRFTRSRASAIMLLGLLALAPATQGQTGQWIRQFDSASSTHFLAVSLHASGVYAAGSTGTGLDAYVVRHDTNGNILWARQFGVIGKIDQASCIAVDASGVYVGGHTYGALPGETNAGGADAFLRKYDLSGNVLWTRQFGSWQLDAIRAVYANAQGVYVAGSTEPALPGQSASGDYDAFVRRYDPNGNEVWTRQFGTTSRDSVGAISADASGLYIAGATGGVLPGQTGAGLYDVFLRKYDFGGSVLWTRQFGSAAQDFNRSVAAGASGIYVTGETTGALPGQTYLGGPYDAFVRKYDPNGNELWTRQFGTAASDYSGGLAIDASGIYIAGATEGSLSSRDNAGLHDAFVRKYDPNGNEIGTQQFGSAGFEQAYDVAVDPSGAYVAGVTTGTLPGQTSGRYADGFLARLDLNVGIDSDNDGLNDFDEVIVHGTDPNDPDTDDDGLLDGTEVDMAAGGPCPDPTVADSDSDTIPDGIEVLQGSSPCNPDSDGDGLRDDVDVLPTVPTDTPLGQEATIRAIADQIDQLPLSSFQGQNDNVRAGRQNTLAGLVRQAANAITQNNSASTKALLTNALGRLDGVAQPPDWMVDSLEKSLLAANLRALITLL